MTHRILPLQNWDVPRRNTGVTNTMELSCQQKVLIKRQFSWHFNKQKIRAHLFKLRTGKFVSCNNVSTVQFQNTSFCPLRQWMKCSVRGVVCPPVVSLAQPLEAALHLFTISKHLQPAARLLAYKTRWGGPIDNQPSLCEFHSFGGENTPDNFFERRRNKLRPN